MLAKAPPAAPMSLSPAAPVVGLPITIVGLGGPEAAIVLGPHTSVSYFLSPSPSASPPFAWCAANAACASFEIVTVTAGGEAAAAEGAPPAGAPAAGLTGCACLTGRACLM